MQACRQTARLLMNSHLDNMSAGAYDAGDSNPWTAGISWTYTTPNAPVAGCMLDYADNYDADATLSDGSCLFASYSPPSTLDLRLHLDPTNSSSYSVHEMLHILNAGTMTLLDLSTTLYGNDGTHPRLTCVSTEQSGPTSLTFRASTTTESESNSILLRCVLVLRCEIEDSDQVSRTPN